MSAQNLPLLPILEGHGLVKTYGSVVALDRVDFAVYPGEVLAVVGDNGAGKSSLVRCLSGAEMPDAGTMRLDGGLIQFRTKREARLAGINAVYQSLKAGPAMDIEANLFRDREPSRPGPLGKVLAWMESNGMRKPASAFDSKVIILDEPTAALDERESLKVRKLIERLRAQGLPIVLVSHNVHQVFQIADRIHVQHCGKRAAVITPQRFSVAEVIAIMGGTLQVDEHDQTLGSVR